MYGSESPISHAEMHAIVRFHLRLRPCLQHACPALRDFTSPSFISPCGFTIRGALVKRIRGVLIWASIFMRRLMRCVSLQTKIDGIGNGGGFGHEPDLVDYLDSRMFDGTILVDFIKSGNA
jgi:tRNA(Arg) A34 adenosine deaminase TadA